MTRSEKKQNPALVIFKRELAAYFSGPIAYIVTGLFLIFSGVIFFTAFYLQNRASLRNLFSMLPILLSVFIPLLTMRLFAEEKRIGSIETLLTLPVTEFDVVLGKFLAAFVSSAAMLAPTVIYLSAILPFGRPDAGQIIGGYLGALFLCAAFSSIGLFASSITKNQIIAVFTSFIICIFLTMINEFLMFIPGFLSPLVKLFSFISASEHFTSISRGIIDTRDLLYFVSITAFFFGLTVKLQQKEHR